MMTRATLFDRIGALAVATMVTAGGLWATPARGQVPPAAPMPPVVGEKVRDFSLKTLDGTTVSVSGELAKGPVVLVVLRGWPGYQCPFCTKQFGDYRTNAAALGAAGVRVLFVYPGPVEGLQMHAEAFAASAPLPANCQVLLDPDYAFTNAYGLRWNARGETAYPATFVITADRAVAFAKVSSEHGDRVTVASVLEVLRRSK